MMLSAYNPDGTTPLYLLRFGEVAAGQSASIDVLVRNDDTATAESVLLMIDQVGTVDLEQWLSVDVNGQTVTFAGGPLDLPDIPAGDTLALSVTVTVPADAPPRPSPLVAVVKLSSYQAA